MKSGRKLETMGGRMGGGQRKCFECGHIVHIAKECTKRTAVETKGRSDGNISKDNIRSYGGNDVSVFHVGRRSILPRGIQQRLCFV